ncbi:MAG: AAA family ATPase [Anaerolineae bacterium]|nr:AAA family ATPase [Anaerolineae bacterium]
MTKTIAVAGKGGVGKTTATALFIRYLVEQGARAVLAVDADPSSNLHMLLGVPLEGTVGDTREEMLQEVQASLVQGGAAMGLAAGMTKADYLDYHIRTLISEGDHVDLIAMGRPEGPGCYCAVNHNLREVIDAVGGAYQYVVIDNEAGLEHLSRRTTRDVDAMFIVSDPTPRGLITAERVVELRDEVAVNIKNTWLVLNRVVGAIPDSLLARIEKIGVPLLGDIPYDEALIALEMEGGTIMDLPLDAPSYQAVAAMAGRALKGG